MFSDSCFDCHLGDEAKGSLDLKQLLASPRSAATDRAWWNVLKNVRAGTMPPPDSGYSLSFDDRQQLYDWLKYSALGIDREHADPGRVTVRRLNRREYANTIRDLMGLDYNADVVFPPDDTGFGFDNVGDALSLSPLLIEKYLNAATEIVAQSVPTICKVIPEQRFRANDFEGEEGKHADNMRAERHHEVVRRVRVDQDGQYELSVDIKSQGSFDFSPQRCTVTFTVNDQQLHSGEYGWDESKHDRHTFMVDWTAGEYELKFVLEPLPLPEDTKVGPNLHTEIDVEEVAVRGPTDPSKWRHPPGYERFFDRDEPPLDADERR